MASSTWAEAIRSRALDNVEVLVPTCSGPVQLPADAFRTPAACPDYAAALDEEQLDVVIVDGLDRNGCVVSAIRNGVGVVIIDNTDERYASDLTPAFEALADASYRRFDFAGVAPGSWRESSTTLFLASTNCFDL